MHAFISNRLGQSSAGASQEIRCFDAHCFHTDLHYNLQQQATGGSMSKLHAPGMECDSK